MAFDFYEAEPDAFPINTLVKRLTEYKSRLENKENPYIQWWEINDYMVNLMRWSCVTQKPIPKELRDFLKWHREQLERAKHP